MSTTDIFLAKVRRFSFALAALAMTAVALPSCSGLRLASEERPLLVENDIRINGRPTRSDDDFEIMRQSPNKTLLGQRFFLSVYGTGKRMGKNSFGNWLQRIGEPPVYFDSIEQMKSAQQLGLHYFNNGYYEAEITSHHEQKGRKVKAYYEVFTGPRYRIAHYDFYSTDRQIDSTLHHYPGKNILEGDPIVAEKIEAEQLALANFFKSQGYYQAQLDWIYFEVDTTGGASQTRLTCVVDPYIYGEMPQRYRMGRIRIQPTYSYRDRLSASDSTRTTHGMDVLQTKRKFRPEFIDRQVFLTPGAFYDQGALQATYKNLSSLGVFSNVEVNLIPSDTALEAEIKMVPMPRRAVAAGLEGTGNSGSLGIGGNLSWDNRNLFGGGEVLRLSLGGSVSEQRNSSNTSWLIDARELNANATLNIPQFMLPQAWLAEGYGRLQPRTRIGANLSYQFRANEFNRTYASTHLDYSWKSGPAKHTLTPWRFSYVAIDFASDTAASPFLFVGFQNLILSSSAYTFSDTWTRGKDRFFISTEVETGGHLLHLVGIDEIGTNPVSRYVKGSLDFRYYHPVVRKREWAARTFIGISQAWGSENGFVPFEKSFYMGGANDLRGWTAYHFGPGATPEDLLQTSGYFSAAPIKIIQSVEWRFTVADALKGALFVDAGNIWLHNREYSGNFTPDQLSAISAGTFRWDRFYRQFGVNTGYGLRYDVEFFILRADLGFKIYHPGAVDRSNFTFTSPQWRDLNVAVGIGYPF